MSELSTKELFEKLQEKLILNLSENEIPCPDCKGLMFVLIEEKGNGYIKSCSRCHTGKLFICKHCGNGNPSGHCNCKGACEERHLDWENKKKEKEEELFKKAAKIHYKEYDGYFIIDGEEAVKDMDEVEEWLYERLFDGEEVPKYLWATTAEPHFSIDLCDVINGKCEDGYEDMYSHLNTQSNLIAKAQELLSEWEKEQGNSLCIYTQDYKRAIMIGDLIEEIKKEVGTD